LILGSAAPERLLIIKPIVLNLTSYLNRLL